MTSTVEPMDKSQENQLGDEKPMESKLSDKRREDNEAADGRPIPNDAAAETDETWETTRSKLPLRVEVEWLDFEHFKNRYTDDDGLAIIEVLCGDYQTPQEVAKEMARRNHGGQGTRVSTPKPKPRQPIHVDGESMWIQRVRIQSPQLVLLLSRLTGHCDKWATGHPRTFFQPFRAFHHYLPQLKECLRILQSRWASEDVNNGETIVGDLTSLNHVDFSQGKPEVKPHDSHADEEDGMARVQWRPTLPSQAIVLTQWSPWMMLPNSSTSSNGTLNPYGVALQVSVTGGSVSTISPWPSSQATFFTSHRSWNPRGNRGARVRV